jgi:hypothetical protein
MKGHIIAVIAISLTLATGCSGPAGKQTSDKPTLERGWIGGEFKTTRKVAPESPRQCVYVKQLYQNTPAEQAGLQTGDVILKINERSIESLKDFRSVIDGLSPGGVARLEILRAGETMALPVTVGRETYHQWHAIQLGLQLSSKLDLWPDPEFSLAPVARYDRVADRLELTSPEVLLSQHTEDGERGIHSREGWHAWFVIFGAGAHKRILTQEIVAAGEESRPVIRAEARGE